MSGVVLRCPNCGTTRTAPGTCDACHEAEVRYYCTNHTPGLWLNAPTCTQCGARLGAPDRPPAPPPPPSPRPLPQRTPGRPGAPAAASAPSAPSATSTTSATSAPRPRFRPAGRPGAVAPSRRREAEPDAEESLLAPRGGREAPVSSLQELLLAALQARRRPRPARSESREAPPRTTNPGGCLIRFVLLMVFLFLAMVSGMFLFGGSVLRLFLPF